MSCATNDDINKLFTKIKHNLGAPLRKIEIDDDQFCSLLEISIEDYSQYVHEWLIEHQWHSLIGQNVDKIDIAFALTTRSLDFETQFTYAYSKQVGMQSRGPWVLKKDFVTVEPGRQVYEIPADREVNEVLWITPSSIDHALYTYLGFGDHGFGGGIAQFPFGGMGGHGGGGYYVAPAFDVLLRASDYNLKQRMLRSELIYKVTAGDNGTKLLHLFSTPGSKLTFGVGIPGRISLNKSQVWYHYYDTSGMSGDDKKKCLNSNRDIIKMPNEVPLEQLSYCDMNEPTRVWVRRYLMAVTKETLGRVRGKFGGAIKVAGAEVTMDSADLLTESKEEKEKLRVELSERLLALSTVKQLERKAQESENLNKSLGYRPMGIFVI